MNSMTKDEWREQILRWVKGESDVLTEDIVAEEKNPVFREALLEAAEIRKAEREEEGRHGTVHGGS